MAIINIIISICFFKENEKKHSIIHLLLGIIIILGFFEIIRTTLMLVSMILLSIISVIFTTEKYDENEKFNKTLITVNSIICIFFVISIIIPNILFKININRLKSIFPKLKTEQSEWAYVEDNIDEYVFKNKKRKSINTISKEQYGKIYLWKPGDSNGKMVFSGVNIKIDDKIVRLGYTSKGYIINYKGEELLKVYSGFEKKEDFGSKFLTCACVYFDNFDTNYRFEVTIEGMME